MVEIKKIDAHGHFGGSFLGPESSIPRYIVEARKLGIVATIASPGPAPEIVENGRMIRPCLWEVNGKTINYFRQEIDLSTGEEQKRDSENNPYHEVNLSLIEEASKYNQGINGYKILVMPIHHPILDTADEVQLLLSLEDTVALKIHGIATFTGPQDIPHSTIGSLHKVGKPVVVHTDMYRGKITNDIHTAYRLNDPVLWVNWARESGVKTLITHGARLSHKALDLIGQTPNAVVGLSPDLLLTAEPDRLDHSTDEFLYELFTSVSPEKIVFDVDYGWNVSERNQWDKLDWQVCERVNRVADRVGLSQQDLEKVYYLNAVRFYNI